MATKIFDDLPNTEQAGFLDICTQRAISPDEFNVSFTQEIAGDCDVKTCGRVVIVQRGFATRAYEDAEDLPWTDQFSEDMEAKVFG